jgi:LDH2 family malate/lactate/ureidoglycolate dehydrogenase
LIEVSKDEDAQTRGRIRVDAAELEGFCRALLNAVGTDEATADAATRAMMHGSRLGVDSHGIRLLAHYMSVFETGRLNRHPNLRFLGEFGAVATLDADHAHGALATYTAMERAVEIAGRMGIGAVAIRNSSHFGPAGAYALAATQSGCIGLAVCNSDSFVRLHDGAERFHGTNPIAVAAPNGSDRPWLLDMATSAVPFNRVLLYRSLGLPLPAGVASTEDGTDTEDADLVAMLAPLGGAFGFKGAAIAGLVEILSATLTGMKLSFDLLPMNGPDMTTPRGLGAFVLAIRPDAFVEKAVYEAGMQRYLATLRGSRPAANRSVMAPGDREWAEAERRAVEGIPIDPASNEAFAGFARRFGLTWPPAA